MKFYRSRILLLFVLLFILSSCTNAKSVSVFDFSDAEHIGYSFEKYCDRTGVSEDAFTIIDPDQHMYVLDTVVYDDVEFHKYLLFGVDDALFGIGYGCRVPHTSTDELKSLITGIYNLFNNEYGEATTYPGIPDRISKIEDYSNVKGGYEEWNFMDGDPMCDLRLSFNDSHDEYLEIQIEYRVATIRNGQLIVQEYIK